MSLIEGAGLIHPAKEVVVASGDAPYTVEERAAAPPKGLTPVARRAFAGSLEVTAHGIGGVDVHASS